MRTKVAGGWLPWSAWEAFRVNASGGFKSSFKKNANGWTPLNGNWKVAKGKYVTSGQGNYFATSSHSGDYATFTYEVRMRRVWEGTCNKAFANAIYVRGDPYPLTGIKQWDDYMRFTYSNRGDYAKAEGVNGVYYPLGGAPSEPINKRGWNTLLVVATGDTYWLYINGQHIGGWTDDSHTFGQVGVGFFQDGGCSDKFQVDWAKLSQDTPW